MNTNKQEIENFDKYAHEWWNKRGPYKLLHNLTPIRLDYIINQIDVKKRKILDIGCGGGLLSEALSYKGAIVDGIDASTDTIHIAKNHAKECLQLSAFFRIQNFPCLDDGWDAMGYGVRPLERSEIMQQFYIWTNKEAVGEATQDDNPLKKTRTKKKSRRKKKWW